MEREVKWVEGHTKASFPLGYFAEGQRKWVFGQVGIHGTQQGIAWFLGRHWSQPHCSAYPSISAPSSAPTTWISLCCMLDSSNLCFLDIPSSNGLSKKQAPVYAVCILVFATCCGLGCGSERSALESNPCGLFDFRYCRFLLDKVMIVILCPWKADHGYVRV